MPLKKNAIGSNMYPWVTHMHTHLGGECEHKCQYCYVENARFGRNPKYSGPIRLFEEELKVNYGSGRTIFIEHMNDCFANNVPSSFINRIIAHCLMYPDNVYLFQTKNPRRLLDWCNFLPENSIVGTTIETNRDLCMSNAPKVADRYSAMLSMPTKFKRFITIEPVLDFDIDVMVKWISEIHPDFINLGADSKGHGLPEPTVSKIVTFVEELKKTGIELKEKHNLKRLLP